MKHDKPWVSRIKRALDDFDINEKMRWTGQTLPVTVSDLRNLVSYVEYLENVVEEYDNG